MSSEFVTKTYSIKGEMKNIYLKGNILVSN